MGLWKRLRKAAKKVAKAVVVAVSAVTGATVGAAVGGVVAPLFGVDPFTGSTIGLMAGGIAGGTAAATGGLEAGLKAAVGIFGWAFDRIRTLATKGRLGPVFSLFLCPAGIQFFLFTEGLNRYRNLNFSSQELPDTSKTLLKRFFPNMRLDEIAVYDGANVFPSWAEAITFRKTIFMRGVIQKCDFDDHKVLTHELTHVRQYHQLGFLTFACRYAGEVLQNPGILPATGKSLETEAEEYEDGNQHNLYADMQKLCGTGPYDVHGLPDPQGTSSGGGGGGRKPGRVRRVA